MQRFKKEFAANTSMSRLSVERMISASSDHGKFVYGANDTLTQAARWRIAAMREIRLARIWYEGHYDLTTKGKYRFYLAKSNSRNLLDSSRCGGCRLPA